MSHARASLQQPLRLLVLSALLLVTGIARADDYADVNQLLRSGRNAEALARADQFLKAKPRDPQMRFLKGVIQSGSGQVNEAIATFSGLTEDFPELPEPHNNLAVMYAGQGQFDKARAALETAIRANPAYATAHENLGDVYAKLASQSYGKALELDAKNTTVQPKLALIRELFAPTGRVPRPTSGITPSVGSAANAASLAPASAAVQPASSAVRAAASR